MDVFQLRDRVVGDYANYVRSFLSIRNEQTRRFVDGYLTAGNLWPEPLVQLNPSFEPGASIPELVSAGLLHPECERIFRRDKTDASLGTPLVLHRHQEDAVRAARSGESYVLTTGTGSGKSLGYFIPIVDHVLRQGTGEKSIKAIVVYPMNALANSQVEELRKFLERGYPGGRPPVTFGRYTGQESEDDRERLRERPPDILLTNFVMLELLLTRPIETRLIDAARGLQFLVLDELHTLGGGGGASLLVARPARAKPNLCAQLLRRHLTPFPVGGLPQTLQQAARIGGRAQQMGRFFQPPQLVFGDQHHIRGAATMNDRRLAILQHPVDQRREVRAGMCVAGGCSHGNAVLHILADHSSATPQRAAR